MTLRQIQLCQAGREREKINDINSFSEDTLRGEGGEGVGGRGLLLHLRGRQILRKWEGVKENGEGFELGRGVRERKRKKRRGKGEKVKRGRVR